MTPVVFVDGDQGTTGLQILARLAGRADVEVATLPPEHRKDAERRRRAIDACDVAVLCLPDVAAREAAGWVSSPSVRIVDASSAHRTDPSWVYGLPELDAGQPARIAAAARVSNPGCYPTGAVALLRPLVASGLLPADYPIVIHAVSGYSGRGREGIDAHEGPDRASAPPLTVYGVQLDHKHVPEIQRHAGLAQRPVFVPAYGAFRQGIVMTVPLHLRLMAPGADGAAVHACLAARYAASRDVEVAPLAETRAVRELDPRALVGTDRLRLGVFANDAHGQVLLTAVFDNLGKGAAGAAVRNLDLMLGRVTS
jgi:N-acetyl-gamma-glutamyl-phosphate reductase